MTIIMNFGFGTRQQPLPLMTEKKLPNWKQVRGAAVAQVQLEGENCGEVDALWTRQSGLPVGIITADCVPILVYRNDLKAVGAIHAGWQGTEKNIVEHFFHSLPADLADPKEWSAHLGPSIRACCYEFGADLLEQFVQKFSWIPRTQIEPAPRRLDLIAINSAVMNRLGVQIKSVHPDCTFCAKDEKSEFRYFSHRRGDRNSRMVSVIQLK